MDLAWKYFQQHASQRIAFFNFFVILASSMTVAVVTAVAQLRVYAVGLVVGLMLAFVSFVFWKVDDRNKVMTKLGEDALKALEMRYSFGGIEDSDDGCPSCVRMFNREVWQTEQAQAKQDRLPLWRRQLSHSKSLTLMFVVYGAFGLIIATYSLSAIFLIPTPQQGTALTLPSGVVLTIAPAVQPSSAATASGGATVVKPSVPAAGTAAGTSTPAASTP